MKKLDPTVLKESLYILTATLILSLLMQSVFLLVGAWDYKVLLGNILGIVAAVGNFLLMGITVQSALEKEQKEAKSLMKLSQTLRLLLLFVVALVGYLVPIFSTVAVVIPFLFPRLAITVRPFIKKF